MSVDSLAIFGGSFNPPHSGHRAIIECALKCEFIDFLIVLPNFKNPLKCDSEPFLSDKERFSALELAVREAVDSVADSAHIQAKIYKKTPTKAQIDSVADSAQKGRDSHIAPKDSSRDSRKMILISNYEIMQKKPSFAIHSILHFKNLYAPKNLYFIIGADILDELEKWHKISEIRQNARFIVATRGGIPIPREFLRFEVSENISSSAIRTQKNGTNLANLNLKNGAKKLDILNSIDDKFARNRLEVIINLLDSKKAENIALFDLRETPYITSFVVIATSLADKHSFALLDTLKTELKAQGETFYSTDEDSGDWIIADLGDIMIHIFTENHRKKFNLEEFLSGFKRQ